MTMALDLQHRVSWRADKLLKQRGSFRIVLWLTEGSDGQREWIETGCDAPPGATDQEVLAALATESGPTSPTAAW